MKVSKSIIEERQQEIIKILQENKAATVKGISKLLNVSELTARRDLSKLEKECVIERFHGGARLSLKEPDATVLMPENGLHDIVSCIVKTTPLRERMSEKASEFINYQDTVFVNASTTILSLLKYIDKEDHISVITNNSYLPFAEGAKNAEIVVTGGQIYQNTNALVGEFATFTISKVLATKCILGVHGISAEAGITTLNYQHSEINQKMISMCSGLVVIVAEGIKIGRSHSFISCGIDKINILITDTSADPREISRLEDAGVKVYVIE